jgi:hypothetical protein
MTITLRQESQTGTTTKGSSLTYAELDNNFIDLLTTKLLPIQIDADTGSVKVGEAQNNGVFTITGAGGITTTVTEDSAGNANLTITDTADNEGIMEVIGGSNIEVTQPDSAGAITLEVTNPAILNLDGAVVFTAKNTSGATIEKGQVVYITGHDGTNPTIAIADADDAAKMPAFGLANEQITNTNTGEIITYGPITNIDTSHFTAGEELFVNTASDSADDTITSSAPTGETGLIQKIGKVIRSHSSTGVIFVTGAGRTNATPNLQDGNVFIGNAQNQVSTTSLATYITDRSINALSEDTSPQLGGNLDVNGNKIITASGNANLKLSPHGTGVVEIEGDGASADGTIQLNCSQNSHGIKLASPPHSAGQSYTLTFPSTAPGANKILETDANGDLTFIDTPSGGISDVVSDTTPQLGGPLDVNGNDIVSASNGNIDIQPNGTGKTNIKNMTYDENIHTITYGANITPEPTDGPIQKILLTGNVAFQGFATEIEGSTVTLIIEQDGTGNHTFSESLDSGNRMLFAGGTSTLSTAANAIDIMTITFVGGTYFASLSTNFS